MPALLLATPWFAQLDAELLYQVLADNRVRALSPGQWRRPAGDEATGIAAVLSGPVSVAAASGVDIFALLGIPGIGVFGGPPNSAAVPGSSGSRRAAKPGCSSSPTGSRAGG